MAFFPHSDFDSLFRLLDDYDAHRASYRKPQQHTSVRSFTPKFDVRESNDGYHLDGELPGLDQKNIEIEFADSHTLLVKGRVVRNYHGSGDLSHSRIESVSEDHSPNPRQPTVEDADEEGKATKTTSTAVTAPSESQVTTASPDQRIAAPKYWLSERSVGEFHRTFSFPTRVDQDTVKASLKDGILSIVVPKARAPKVKKIRVE